MDTDYEGRLTINDENLNNRTQNDLSAFRNEHIGFVFQFHYLLPEFSVLENVMLPALKLKRLSRPEIESKAYNHLTNLGLKDQALKLASKLSGGQQQRVAIARALINEPSIIMGDEPTGNLDSKNSQLIFDIFRDIVKQGRQTIIAVTHDEDFAANCDRVLELSDGHLVK
jgi:lipoprotein-releasing system ATP-binding protein